jgi:hypothetical protein
VPDIESVAAELYAKPRADFVTARNELARQAPAELAAAIRALPKPTTAAWLVNLVALRHPADVDRLIELGRALRQAYADRAGDRLRELVRQRHEVLRQLTGDVRSVARAEGHTLAGPVADQVQETFEAALLDADIGRSVQSRRLATAARVPAMVGLPALPEPPADKRREPPADKPPKPATPARRETPKVDRQRDERERGAALARARRQVNEAKAARKRAAQELARTTKIAERASARVAELTAELDQAREAEQQAEQDVADATEQAELADRAVEDAQQLIDKR